MSFRKRMLAGSARVPLYLIIGTAALLGTFRLIERGEIGLDEAVELFDRGQRDLPTDWVEGVSEITVEDLELSSAKSGEEGLLDVMAGWASASFGELSGTVRQLRAELSAARLKLLPTISGADPATGPGGWGLGQM